jgi:hypothetical protein
MAYSTASTAIKPGLLSPRFAAGWSTAMYQYGGSLWVYFSTADNIGTVEGASYFTDGYSLGMRHYDTVIFTDVNSTIVYWLTVTSQTSSGNDPRAVTVSSLLTT